MRIITYKSILEFSLKHPQAETPLNDWYHKVKKTEWQNLNEIKQTYNNVDYVGNHRYVFNIKGNDYRLVAIISFNTKKVYIRFIGTHAEYDTIIDIKNI
jgi:mRNA interferase HigB